VCGSADGCGGVRLRGRVGEGGGVVGCGRGGGAIRVECKSNKTIDTHPIEDKAIAYTHKKNSTS